MCTAHTGGSSVSAFRNDAAEVTWKGIITTNVSEDALH